MCADLTSVLDEAFKPHPPDRIGVAVSGGGDSMALLHLMQRFCADRGVTLHAVTVDHGVRPEAAVEARHVGQICAELGVPHDILEWRGWRGKGNLQHEGRKARYDLISTWARDHDLQAVCLGHTADDQAETVLMRLARRSGVDGLSAMAPRTQLHRMVWVRPLLSVTRADLRAYLTAEDVAWVDDPSNEDTQFARIKARKALQALAPLGIDAEVLAEVAANMKDARTALNWNVFLSAKDIVTVTAGAVAIDERGLRILPNEICRRLLVHAVRWISGGDYAPRRATVAGMIEAINRGEATTLQGCRVQRSHDRIWIFRELKAVENLRAAQSELWDNRWRLTFSGPMEGEEEVAALGAEGLLQCPDWRASGLPRAMLLSTPAIWRGETLIAAPLAAWPQNWQAEVEGGADGFFAALLSH